MMVNLIDIDEAMASEACLASEAIGLFYDFKAAFPSVEHELLHAYFLALGWPTWLCTFVEHLYMNIFCFISLATAFFCGFGLTRGIRQGCPLSPLLLSASSELLLLRLRRLIFDTTNRA